MADPKNKNGGGDGPAKIFVIVGTLTVLCGGAGGLFGATVLSGVGDARDAAHEESVHAAAPSHATKDEVHASVAAGAPHDAPTKLAVRELPPIVCNLAAPERSWIRLQSAIVFDPHDLFNAEALVAELMSDVTTYLRTLSVAEIEGAEGLRRLQEELSARAATRSERRVKEFVIESLVVQ